MIKKSISLILVIGLLLSAWPAGLAEDFAMPDDSISEEEVFEELPDSDMSFDVQGAEEFDFTFPDGESEEIVFEDLFEEPVAEESFDDFESEDSSFDSAVLIDDANISDEIITDADPDNEEENGIPDPISADENPVEAVFEAEPEETEAAAAADEVQAGTAEESADEEQTAPEADAESESDESDAASLMAREGEEPPVLRSVTLWNYTWKKVKIKSAKQDPNYAMKATLTFQAQPLASQYAITGFKKSEVLVYKNGILKPKNKSTSISKIVLTYDTEYGKLVRTLTKSKWTPSDQIIEPVGDVKAADLLKLPGNATIEVTGAVKTASKTTFVIKPQKVVKKKVSNGTAVKKALNLVQQWQVKPSIISHTWKSGSKVVTLKFTQKISTVKATKFVVKGFAKTSTLNVKSGKLKKGGSVTKVTQRKENIGGRSVLVFEITGKVKSGSKATFQIIPYKKTQKGKASAKKTVTPMSHGVKNLKAVVDSTAKATLTFDNAYTDVQSITATITTDNGNVTKRAEKENGGYIIDNISGMTTPGKSYPVKFNVVREGGGTLSASLNVTLSKPADAAPGDRGEDLATAIGTKDGSGNPVLVKNSENNDKTIAQLLKEQNPDKEFETKTDGVVDDETKTVGSLESGTHTVLVREAGTEEWTEMITLNVYNKNVEVTAWKIDTKEYSTKDDQQPTDYNAGSVSFWKYKDTMFAAKHDGGSEDLDIKYTYKRNTDVPSNELNQLLLSPVSVGDEYEFTVTISDNGIWDYDNNTPYKTVSNFTVKVDDLLDTYTTGLFTYKILKGKYGDTDISNDVYAVLAKYDNTSASNKSVKVEGSVSVKDASNEITIWDNLPVYVIGEAAFENDEIIESVELPNAIMVIGERAFSNCIKLASMTCK